MYCQSVSGICSDLLLLPALSALFFRYSRTLETSAVDGDVGEDLACQAAFVTFRSGVDVLEELLSDAVAERERFGSLFPNDSTSLNRLDN